MNGSDALRRYSRHLLIPEIGLAGQERLAAARALVVGAGGLGVPVLQYLVAAGVGRIGICDDDVVELSNLQRQVLYDSGDLGKKKAAVAAEHLRAQNPQVALDPLALRFDAGNARELVRLYDLVIDATDSFEARYLINDAARLEGKPDIYAAIFRFEGQVSVFDQGGPCYRCLFPAPPPPGSVPSCAEGGVLGVLAGLVGTLQANEALKVLLGIGRPLLGRLLLIDALAPSFREVAFAGDPECALHGARRTIFEVVAAPSTASEAVSLGELELEAAQLDAFLAREPRARVLDV
ncbi:MAG: HesA/MoeB/ThiF family protein, partial [Vulcanimicrobiaceae bacterium]